MFAFSVLFSRMVLVVRKLFFSQFSHQMIASEAVIKIKLVT